MNPKEPLSCSRLGPMDPRQFRLEAAAELAAPALPGGTASGGAGGPANRRRRRGRLRRRQAHGG